MDNIAVVGARGLVGRELVSLLKCMPNPPKKIEQLARVEKYNFKKFDLVFLCTPAKVAKVLAPLAISHGATVIDLSSAHRTSEHACLFHAHTTQNISGYNLYSIPNCVASIMISVLAPLHKQNKITRIFASTYQAASGAGKKGIEELLGGGKPQLFPHKYEHNIFLHEASEGEEEKIAAETRKLLKDDTIGMHVRTVRVPVLRAHSATLNVTFKKYLSPEAAGDLLTQAPGVLFSQSPNPLQAENQDEVFYGPIRQDHSLSNTLDFWICGDQLLRGAALNALDCFISISARFAK